MCGPEPCTSVSLRSLFAMQNLSPTPERVDQNGLFNKIFRWFKHIQKFEKRWPWASELCSRGIKYLPPTRPPMIQLLASAPGYFPVAFHGIDCTPATLVFLWSYNLSSSSLLSMYVSTACDVLPLLSSLLSPGLQFKQRLMETFPVHTM